MSCPRACYSKWGTRDRTTRSFGRRKTQINEFITFQCKTNKTSESWNKTLLDQLFASEMFEHCLFRRVYKLFCLYVLYVVLFVCVVCCFPCMCCMLFWYVLYVVLFVCVVCCFACMCCMLFRLYVLYVVSLVCVVCCFACMCCMLFCLHVLLFFFIRNFVSLKIIIPITSSAKMSGCELRRQCWWRRRRRWWWWWWLLKSAKFVLIISLLAQAWICLTYF